MRILSGTAGGRRIRPAGPAVRPTEAKVKAALFSILGEHVVGADVLDLFAGSGALGLEALSRGASRAVFVDAARAASDAVTLNARALGFDERAQVLREPCDSALRRLSKAGRRFDLVLCDPPYDQHAVADVLRALDEADVVASAGIVVAECSKREVLPDKRGDLVQVAAKVYGDTRLTFWRREQGQEGPPRPALGYRRPREKTPAATPDGCTGPAHCAPQQVT